MSKDRVKIAFTGIYDIANYGDHLFPLIFDAVMKLKGIDCEMFLFSSFGGQQSFSLDKQVYRLTDLEIMHEKHDFDAIIVGGGGILHYANGGQKLTREAEEYVTYPVFESWVIPSFVAYKYNVKLLWNLPGGFHDFPDFYQELTLALCSRVDYMSVRDNYTKKILTDSGIVADEIKVYPDSAFMMRESISDHVLQTTRNHIYDSTKPYVVFHGNRHLPAHCIADVVEVLDYYYHKGYQVVLLPLAYTHDDESLYREINDAANNRYFMFEKELNVDEIMSMLAGSYMYIGVSFHGAITTICHGKKAIAFDYMYNGKTKDLYDYVGLSNYYINDSKDLLACAKAYDNDHSVVDISNKVSQLHVHFDELIGKIFEPINPRVTDGIFLTHLSKAISYLTDSYFNWKALESNYRNLDAASKTAHEELHNLKYYFNELDTVSRIAHEERDDLKLKVDKLVINHQTVNEECESLKHKLSELERISNNKYQILQRKHDELQQTVTRYQASPIYKIWHKVTKQS